MLFVILIIKLDNIQSYQTYHYIFNCINRYNLDLITKNTHVYHIYSFRKYNLTVNIYAYIISQIFLLLGISLIIIRKPII